MTIFYILFRGPGLTKACLSFKVTDFFFLNDIEVYKGIQLKA